MTKKRGRGFLKRQIPQILVQSLAILLTALVSYLIMTWLIRDIAKVDSTYLGAVYEILGTLCMMILILVSTNTYTYRKRVQEVNILSNAIEQVANGDFHVQIPIHPNDPMAQVYADFNKMSSELASVQLLRNDFINNYSHEFKTPIASINGFAALLLDKKLPENEQRQYLEIIRDESERLSRLTSNTILLSKLSSQQIITDMESYNLAEQLRQCSIILSPNWLEKKIEFSGDFPDVWFYGNKELIQHLWLNIIGNAVKFTPSGGEINVSLYEENHTAVVTVTDTGMGMSPETCAHLFDPYYQGDPSRSSQGLGLGLSIAKRIIELNNGTISVNSQPGAGSEFIVTLPIRSK
ncbi:MAG: HAMP domain-containing sensor histidine kinase [Eubacteriales bacterium]|nr:HAMP domain-containing sensor histidine kinase [Eubacteriales bacterium]